MIVSSHAIADPGTVMIHPLDASIALFAVMDSWQFDNIAFLAKSSLFHLSYLFGTKSRYRYSSSNLLLFLRYLFLAFIISVLYMNLVICSSVNDLFLVG